MTRGEIITQLKKENLVRKIINNTNKGQEQKYNMDDLEQDIWLELLTKQSEEKIVELYQKNQIHYFISRLVSNNLKSITSRYYYTYKKRMLQNVEIDDLIKNIPE